MLQTSVTTYTILSAIIYSFFSNIVNRVISKIKNIKYYSGNLIILQAGDAVKLEWKKISFHLQIMNLYTLQNTGNDY